MSTWVNVAQIIISIVLIVILLLQAKGAGWTGFAADQASVFRTRRGIQRTLFQLTIVLALVFVIVSLFSSYLVSHA